ncbi:hypothetical protein SH611_12360 [Geminicoccaceae bacterium 1502E]|nr:hypothetical protein [Geminicoccaceae bacterium 1502E]
MAGVAVLLAQVEALPVDRSGADIAGDEALGQPPGMGLEKIGGALRVERPMSSSVAAPG